MYTTRGRLSQAREKDLLTNNSLFTHFNLILGQDLCSWFKY